MPEDNRRPLFTENHMRIAFTAVTIGMILGIFVIFFLITARPTGQFTRPDTWQYEQNLERTSQQLSGFRELEDGRVDRKSTRLNSSHVAISYAVFCLKKKT